MQFDLYCLVRKKYYDIQCGNHFENHKRSVHTIPTGGDILGKSSLSFLDSSITRGTFTVNIPPSSFSTPYVALIQKDYLSPFQLKFIRSIQEMRRT